MSFEHMNFERSEILRPILDDLGAGDPILFRSLQQKIHSEASAQGTLISSSTMALMLQAFQVEITERAKRTFSEIRRVISGAYIEDFDSLREALKSELTTRLESIADIAAAEYSSSTATIRSQLHQTNLPSENALSEHLKKLKPKWFAEIELFCLELHDTQAPRLFLKAGEVFAGNRAARAIFTAARQSLDIIDTWFGPSVFDMLELTPPSVQIRLISNRADATTKAAFALFDQQFPNRIQFRLCNRKDIHDRFIIVDKTQALHLGASIKDLGKSDSLIDQAKLEPHRKRFEELWFASQPVT
jgi:hypothetical protein